MTKIHCSFEHCNQNKKGLCKSKEIVIRRREDIGHFISPMCDTHFEHV